MSEDNAGHFKKGFDRRRVRRYYDGKTLAQIAREHTPEAIELLRSVIADPDEKTSDRLRAAEYLLNRGYGKPVSVVQMEVNDTSEIRELTREALLALANGQAPNLPVTLDGEALAVPDTVQANGGGAR